MPVLDGLSAAEVIGRESIAPVVMLTAFSQREFVERARDAGVMAYVVKLFTIADLTRRSRSPARAGPQTKALELEIADLEERLETRKSVDRAKGHPHGQAAAEQVGRLPVDPEDRDGPADGDAQVADAVIKSMG